MTECVDIGPAPALSPRAGLPLAGLPADAEVRARLRDACERAGLPFPGIAESRGVPAWYFEAGKNLPLFDRDTLSRAWNRRPYTMTICLVSRLEPSGERQVLGTARVGTRGSLSSLREKQLLVAELLLRQALRGGQSAIEDPACSAEESYFDDAPGVWTGIGGWLRHASMRFRASLYQERWSIGIAQHGVETVAATGALGPISWLVPRAGVGILADPFWWPGSSDMLCEEQRLGLPGEIVLFKGDGKNELSPGPVFLSGPGHLSYPCTFAHEGEIYVVPESIEADTTIWRVGADGALEEASTVASESGLADPTLFAWEGRFWIAATDLAIGAHDNLCLFHAQSLEGPWLAHVGNPVKIDIASARSAGSPFVVEGRLIRPSQDCAAGYGAAITLNEVTELSTSKFREHRIQRLVPEANGPYPDGIHTLSAFGNRSLVDGKRLVPRPLDLMRRLGRRLFDGRVR